MSWNKNTISFSELDAIKAVLDELGRKYKLSVLDKVKGRGLNDGWDNLRVHELRRLAYGKFVVLERIEQDKDCDTDDLIISHKFTKESEPTDWKPIKITDKTGQYSY